MSKKKSNCYFPFGKYQSEHIEKVIKDDPQYIGWCAINEIDFVIKYLGEEEADLYADEYKNQREIFSPL